jgi:hypothetical protein
MKNQAADLILKYGQSAYHIMVYVLALLLTCFPVFSLAEVKPDDEEISVSLDMPGL